MTLDGFDGPTIQGCGDNIQIVAAGERVTRGGKAERYELTFKVCRYTVRQLAEEIAKMQARDRDRLARETARLSGEVKSILDCYK